LVSVRYEGIEGYERVICQARKIDFSGITLRREKKKQVE
jgi:hypothetical protein